MTKRQVSFSDLSGQMAPSDGDLIPLIVTDHPDLDEPVRIEVTAEEMEKIGKMAIAAIGLETEPVSDDERRARFVVPVGKFSALATIAPLEQVLADAEPISSPPKARSSSGNGDRRSHNRDKEGNPLTDYSAPENAGLPHNGKVGKRERDYVQANLDEVNARRQAAGHPFIDPANPVDAERYGFTAPGEPPTESGTAPAQDA